MFLEVKFSIYLNRRVFVMENRLQRKFEFNQFCVRHRLNVLTSMVTAILVSFAKSIYKF